MGKTMQRLSYSSRKLAIAVTLAVAAVALMVIYGAQARANGAKTASDKAVLVATRDIPLGTPASEIAGGGWVTPTRLPAGSIAAGALTSVAQLAHLVAVQPTYSGEQITLRRFGRVQQQGLPSELGGSFRIFELSGSATQLLAGTLQRGNRVDVVGSIRLPESGQTHVAAVVLRNLLVVQAPPAAKSSGMSSQDTPVGPASADAAPGAAALLAHEERRLVLAASPERRRSGSRAPAGDGSESGGGHTWPLSVVSEWRSPARAWLPPCSRPTSRAWKSSSWSRSRRFTVLRTSCCSSTASGAEPREQLAALREHSAVPVILATAAPSSELVHWALDAGIADVLPLPAPSEALLFAVEKAARAASQRARVERGRVVTVFSPKGGSGKSVVSTNLAVASAQHTSSRTLLIDLDLQFGDAAIMLGLTPREHPARADRHSCDPRRREARRVHGAARVGRRRSPGTRFAPRTPS